MLSWKMTNNLFSNVAYRDDKNVAICDFVKIQRLISAIGDSITILFKCRH